MGYMQSPMDQWSVTAQTTGANAASASKAAGVAGQRHVARRAIISISVGATQQPTVAFNLRDGATGAGTVLLSVQAAGPANTTGMGSQNWDLDNLNLVGTSATAMTLEAAAAPAASTGNSVTLIGYDFGVKPVAIPPYVA